VWNLSTSYGVCRDALVITDRGSIESGGLRGGGVAGFAAGESPAGKTSHIALELVDSDPQSTYTTTTRPHRRLRETTFKNGPVRRVSYTHMLSIDSSTYRHVNLAAQKLTQFFMLMRMSSSHSVLIPRQNSRPVVVPPKIPQSERSKGSIAGTTKLNGWRCRQHLRYPGTPRSRSILDSLPLVTQFCEDGEILSFSESSAIQRGDR